MANSRSGPKLKTLAEAARLVRAGDMLGVGGMTLYRKPMAFIREIVRAGTGDLTLLTFASSIEAELLALAGKLGTIRTCYMGLEFLGLAPALRRATETGAVRIVEETEYTIVYGLQAALMHVPYLPSRDSEVGTWFPAVAPRVAVIHVPMADAQGNAWLGGQHCIDAQLAMAAEVVIVTAEKIVATEKIRDAQGGAGLVSFMVDAVVEAPGGAHPTSCYPDYPVDVVHIARYLKAARAREAERYLDAFIAGALSLPDYLARVAEDHHARG